MKERLLVHGLRRAGEIGVAGLERIAGATPRTEQVLERGREQVVEPRRASLPLITDRRAVMAEIGEVEGEGAVALERDEPAHSVEKRRRAIGRKPHHLVLVPVIRKTEILGERLVENAERMGEMHPALDSELAPPPYRPGRAREITEAVDRHHGRFLERRYIEDRREMRQVVLDVVECAAKTLARKGLAEKVRNALPLAPVAQPLAQQGDTGRMDEQMADPPEEIGAAVLIDRHVVDVGQAQARLAQAIADGFARESSPMLDATKPLLLGRRDKQAVAHERGRRIAVKGVEAEDDHRGERRAPGAALQALRPPRSAQPLVDDLEGDQRLGHKALERVAPAGPAIEQAAFGEQRVEEYADRRRPTHTADAVAASQRLDRSFGEIARLLTGVAVLRGEPARQRLAVVVIDDAVERAHLSPHHDPVTMAFLAVEHGAWRIERAAQSSPVHAIDEARAIAGGRPRRLEQAELVDERVAELVIRIEREHPGRCDLRQPEIALGREIRERMLDHVDLRIGAQQ